MLVFPSAIAENDVHFLLEQKKISFFISFSPSLYSMEMMASALSQSTVNSNSNDYSIESESQFDGTISRNQKQNKNLSSMFSEADNNSSNDAHDNSSNSNNTADSYSKPPAFSYSLPVSSSASPLNSSESISFTSPPTFVTFVPLIFHTSLFFLANTKTKNMLPDSSLTHSTAHSHRQRDCPWILHQLKLDEK